MRSPIVFNGSESTFDPLVMIECYEWTIKSTIGDNDEVIRTTLTSIDKKYGDEPFTTGQEQDLTVTLRVSDETDFPCSAGSALAFSQFDDVISYQIRCDSYR